MIRNFKELTQLGLELQDMGFVLSNDGHVINRDGDDNMLLRGMLQLVLPPTRILPASGPVSWWRSHINVLLDICIEDSTCRAHIGHWGEGFEIIDAVLLALAIGNQAGMQLESLAVRATFCDKDKMAGDNVHSLSLAPPAIQVHQDCSVPAVG